MSAYQKQRKAAQKHVNNKKSDDRQHKTTE